MLHSFTNVRSHDVRDNKEGDLLSIGNPSLYHNAWSWSSMLAGNAAFQLMFTRPPPDSVRPSLVPREKWVLVVKSTKFPSALE